MRQLLNRADATGTFDEVPTNNFTELTVELSAIGITKTADKDIWVKGELEYTIVITNIDERDPGAIIDPGLPVTGIEVKDKIDPLIATLVDNSVTIDDEPATDPDDYTFDAATGILTVPFTDPMQPGEFHTITFQVEMV